MAYFSNGSEGDMYMAKYCMRCLNWRENERTDIAGCPIIDLHMIGDYDQCSKTEVGQLWKKLLETLIPTQKDDIYPDKCSMFLLDPDSDISGQKKLDFGE